MRGRGLLCRSVMKAQAASPPFTPVYAAMIAIINTKFPMIGELLLMRLLSQFRRAYKRSDKSVCISSSKFIAHLVNQKVANEIVALQILTLLLERPTDDSVEVAVGFMREVGAFLMEESSKASMAVFERFRAILHEGQIDKRTQYMVEVLYQVRKDKFAEHTIIPEGLDIVEEEDQVTHMIGLTDELVTDDLLNVYRHDPDFLENEQKYEEMKREILGSESDDEEAVSGDDEDEDEEDEEEIEKQKKLQIIDKTNTNIINLRRGIYLTIMSSVNFEECAHKLMKLNIESGQEIELCNMIIECCSQEKMYVVFYGLLGERFCNVNESWAQAFAEAFEETYKTIHRFETNRLRNIAKFFSHLLSSNAITWEVFALIRLTEQDTTSSSRIFCKILFQSLVESLGLAKLNERFNDSTMVVTVDTAAGTVTRNVFAGLFPKDNPRDTRFAINYFTSIGLGGVTEELRAFLKNVPKPSQESSSSESDDSSDSSSDDSDSSSASSSSGSRGGARRQRNPSPRRKPRSISPTRSIERERRSSAYSPETRPQHMRSKSRDSDENKSPIRSKGRSLHRDESPRREPRKYHRHSRSRSPRGERAQRRRDGGHDRSISPRHDEKPSRRRDGGRDRYISPRRDERHKRSRSPRTHRNRSPRGREDSDGDKPKRSRTSPHGGSSNNFVHPDRVSQVNRPRR